MPKVELKCYECKKEFAVVVGTHRIWCPYCGQRLVLVEEKTNDKL